MTFVDAYGLTFTTESAVAADRYRDALDLGLSNHVGVRDHLRAALDEDPRFVLARALLAFHLQFDADRGPAVTQILVASKHAVQTTRRERQVVEILRRAIVGDTVSARRQVRQHLGDFPRDALMIREAVYLRGYGGGSGRKASIAAMLGRLAPHMGRDPWFLGIYSLALSEVGELEVATQLAETALTARPDHGVAAHARAHIHFEAGDDAGGRDFLQEWLTTHGHNAVNAGHLAWHQSLAHLALSDPDAALAAYREQRTWPRAQQFPLEDAISLLWRLQLRGIDVSREWAEITCEPPSPSPSRAFQLAHLAFAMAAQRDDDRLVALDVEIQQAIRAQPQEPLRYLPPLVRALRLIAADRWSEAAPALAAAAGGARRLGGSNEQHTLIDETVVYAGLSHA